MSWASRAVALLALAALGGALAPTAAADGDPASDYLIGQAIFAPYDPNVPLRDAGQLDVLVRGAEAQGFTIRVALIGKRSDLGSVTALWRQPQRYAQFLSEELFYAYKQTLLIVMPNGYGVARLGRPLPSEQRLLAGIGVPATGFANLPVAAAAAVQRLAEVRGIHLDTPTAPKAKSRDNRDRITILAAVAAAAALVAGLAFARRRWQAAGATRRGEDR
jgi:hypothetical protein